ncbi:MAG: AAA family ATPase [Armatimonadetes bacterium]|nr:AAA family ATPase [Armatimonadota bacterium]
MTPHQIPLFGEDEEPHAQAPPPAPLAARMRPRNLEEYIGQEQILGPGRLLRRAIETDKLASSIILWGPPGTGKTTLAHVIASSTRARFVTVSAVMAGVKELRALIEEAREHLRTGRRTVLLVDEIHRFNKAQQDALLPHVENGTVVLIGATTENPFFEVNNALLSRSRLFRLEPLSREDLKKLLRRALEDPERGYGQLSVRCSEEGLDHLAEVAGGDARTALNALELAVESAPYDAEGNLRLDVTVAQEAIQRKMLRYDKGGDEHYDTISAFIKSVRGSDPDAALFWLARMVEAGEDPRFIMRRLLILAGEDIGLADPQGIVVAAACASALEWVGLPEARYHLALATTYLATAPKSNSMTGYFEAEAAARNHPGARVPIPLRDSHYRGAGRLGHGKGYQYPHEFPDHYVPQQYLPDELKATRFYHPSALGHERTISKRMQYWARRNAGEGVHDEDPAREA